MSVYIRELSRELGRLGHPVDIFTGAGDPTAGSSPQRLYPNVRLVRLPLGPGPQLPKAELHAHLSRFALAFEDFCGRTGADYDLIHSHYWLSGRVGEAVRAERELPHIVTFHTLGALKNAVLGPESAPSPRVAAERALAASCDRIVVTSRREQGNLIRHYGAHPERVRLVPCGVDPALFRPLDRQAARRGIGVGDDERIALYVGRFAPEKGLDRLLRAFARLAHIPRLRLVVVGGMADGDPQFGRMRALARSLGIDDRVAFTGRVEHAQLPAFYSAADVLALPSSYESFGMVGLEVARLRDAGGGHPGGGHGRADRPGDQRLHCGRVRAGGACRRHRAHARASRGRNRERARTDPPHRPGLPLGARRPGRSAGLSRRPLFPRTNRRRERGRAGAGGARRRSEMTEPVDVLVIAAHPDDAEFGAAGTLAKWTRDGRSVAYVVCTGGEKGTSDPTLTPEALRQIREGEQRAAARTLGVQEVVFLGLPDQGLEDTAEFRKLIVRMIRAYRPAIVMTSDPYRRYIWHRDHRIIGQVVLDAIFPFARDHLAYPDLLSEGLLPHKVKEIYFWGTEDINVRSDITETFDLKIAALRCHASQMRALPAGDPEEWLRRRCREMAAGESFGLAEAFHLTVAPP